MGFRGVGGQLAQTLQLVFGRIHQLRGPGVADAQFADQPVHHGAHSLFGLGDGGLRRGALLSQHREFRSVVDFLFVSAAAFLIKRVLPGQRFAACGGTPTNLS